MIKNLVFKGGGVLGIAYSGVIEVLEEKKILQKVERVAGTSAGAITACLLSLKYTNSEILEITKLTNFKSFEDGFNPFRLFSKFGFFKGDKFLFWLKQFIVKKGLPENATFADFKKAGFLDLHVFATDLNSPSSLTRFSYSNTPNVIVAEAVRASMSIPLFFKAWKFSNNIPNDHIYVDGGVVYNFPLSTFDDVKGDNPETLGFFLTNLNNTQPMELKFWQPFKYFKLLIEAILNSQNINLQADEDEENRTVMIDNLGISSTNFDITEFQKQQLYESGKKYTLKFLETH